MKNKLGEQFLIEMFSNLMYQTYKNFEIVISDQSSENNLKLICDTFSHVFDIKYIQYNEKQGITAANVNSALKHATGDIIKILFMDDFFVDPFALQKIVDAFSTNSGNWLLIGFTHCNSDRTQFFDTRTPWYGNKIVNGDNTTGNPSAYAVRKTCLLEMDENLLWIVDGEYFYRTYFYHGDPIILNDILVCFREHDASAFKDQELMKLRDSEMKYCVEKFERLK
jgi:GT2 family glycosyltransferase